LRYYEEETGLLFYPGLIGGLLAGSSGFSIVAMARVALLHLYFKQKGCAAVSVMPQHAGCCT
jgi:hypothetical protein